MDDDNYTNVHRGFLQACGRFSVLGPNQALNVLASVQAKHGDGQGSADDATLRALVNEINAKLTSREIKQRLNFVQFEWDHPLGEFLILCNTFDTVGPSPVNNEAECVYMKVLIEKIVLSDAHTISTMMAIHVSSEASQQHSQQSQSATSTTTKKITKQRAEELLDEWIATGYFLLLNDADALITLGPKTIAEFRDTLRTKFPDFIQNCHLCSEIVMKPLICPNDDCEASLHKRCFESYVAKQKKCPACKSNWEIAE